MPRPTHKLARASKAIALAATLSLTSTASATWSILITDTRTGEFVVGSATCLTGFDLARETPVVLTGIGAITAQSSVDINGNNRMFIRDRLLEGQPLSQILTELETFDPGHNNRQYGMITTNGDVLTYSGIQNANWAGGSTGRIEQGRPGPADDIVYTVQGNILSGPNVVDAAVDAIINTDTDLPGKLMASMLAARVAGGDGRCSCSNANPTGCGSPPPAPFKSAHVGYMIGSRADDTDSIRAFYRLPANSTSLTQLNTNTFAIADTDENIHLYVNATNTNNEVAHFNLDQTIETTLPSIDKVVAADLDNNGLKDLVAHTSSNTIAIFLQTEHNTFDTSFSITLQDEATNITPFSVPDHQADLLLIAHPNLGLNGQAVAYQLNNQSLDTIRTIDTQAQGAAAIFTDIVPGDDIQNLFFIAPDFMQIRTYEVTNDARFLRGTSINPEADPQQLRVADVNNDTYPDLIVATGSSRALNTFLNLGPSESYRFNPFPVSSPLASGAIDFQVTDLNNDNIQDAIVLLQSGANLRYYLGDNAGNFTETDRTRIGGTPTDALLADLNNDGDMDLITNATDQLLIYDNLQNATVQRQTGFARGDKFMFINIANQGSAAPDPVDQMLTRFDEFRAELTDLPDAVQTTVTQPSRILIDDAGQAPKLRVHIKDYQQQTLDSPAIFNLEFNPSHLTPGLPEFVADGIYDIPLTALSENGAKAGNHTLTIRVTANEHTVTLMPTLTISTTTNLADFNADDALNFLDISIFINALSNQLPTADLNNDGFYNQDDINIFITAYKAAP